MEARKDLNYDFYPKNIVDDAYDFATSYYKYEGSAMDKELITKLHEKGKLDDKQLKFMYDNEVSNIEFAFIQGIRYAIANDIGSMMPDDNSKFSQYHKDKDFAFLFDFCDNDFGLYFERAVKLYCNAYNELLWSIDAHQEYCSVDSYINNIKSMESPETIKEILKIGVTSYSFERDVDTFHIKNINFDNTKDDAIRLINEYLPFNSDKRRWEKDENGEYVEITPIPRLVTGTVSEIEEALKEFGTPDREYDDVPARDFPVWCNGEVIIVYMKNGYLTYITR